MSARASSLDLCIVADDLSGPEIAAFLAEHLRDMHATSPPESVHALDLDGLRRPEVAFWSAWRPGTLVGCGAFKRLDATHAELKSMRTHPAHRGTGVGTAILRHLLAQARSGGFHRVSLETGSMAFFAPARALYVRHGFLECPPFADYREDQNSVYMTLLFAGGAER